MPYLQPVFITGRRDNGDRSSLLLHRDGVTSADKLATVTPTAAKNDNITGVMAASAHYFAVAPGNRYGPVTPTKGSGTITPTLNKTVDVAITQVTGAEWYDIFYSTDAEPKWVGRVTEAMRANGCAITAVGTSAAVYQVETATVVGTVTGAGNAAVVVTANGMTGSPKTINVTVEIGDNAAAVAGKIRTALAADSAVAALFGVSGTGATVVLTKLAGAANDATLNISVDNGTCTGLTTAATSANTTWGIDPGKVNVRLVGTGAATNADPFKFNNAYTPASVAAINCDGKTTAHVLIKLAVTDLRSAPTLVLLPFLKNYTSGDFVQHTAQTITLLTAAGKCLEQTFDVDVNGASGFVVLIDTITGEGAACTIHVELS
jgi:hypothetical protein